MVLLSCYFDADEAIQVKYEIEDAENAINILYVWP